MATDPSQLPKGPGSAEEPGTGVPANLPGVYKHGPSGNTVTVMPDAKSTGQQDALVRMGFERVGDAPSRTELNEQQKAQAEKDRKAGLDGSVPASTGTFGTPLDYSAPRHNPTSTVTDTAVAGQTGNNDAAEGASDAAATAQAEAAAATARAEKAEAELAALKAGSEEKSDEGSTDEGEASEGDETPADPAPGDETKTEEGAE